MTPEQQAFVGALADFAAITTAFVALWAWGSFLVERHRRRIRLEEYLKKERLAREDHGRRSLLHLIAALGMTEAQVLDAVFRSKCINRVVGMDDRGRADAIFVEYTTGDINSDWVMDGMQPRRGPRS